jgi:6-phosphogluconate dehydrogenase
LNYAGIASMWRGGCIIKVCFLVCGSLFYSDPPFQSVFLSDITAAYRKNPQLESLLFDDFFNKGESTFRSERPSLTSTAVCIPAVHRAQPGWRRIIAQAVLWGIPTPAFSTALAFFDGYRSEIVPANLLQAQVCLPSRLQLPPLICSPARLLRRPHL